MLSKLAALFTFVAVSCAAIHLPLAAPFRRPVINSVARIHFESEDGSLIGTAFAIDKDQLLTAGHVCSGAQEMAIAARVPAVFSIDYVDATDNISTKNGVTIVRLDSVYDLCLVKLVDHGLRPIPLEKDWNSVHRLDHVYVVGAPLGEFPIMKDGFIASKDSEDQDNNWFKGRLQTSIEALPGYSGSPVLRNGYLVGTITSGKFYLPVLPSNGSFGASLPQIVDFLNNPK